MLNRKDCFTTTGMGACVSLPTASVYVHCTDYLTSPGGSQALEYALEEDGTTTRCKSIKDAQCNVEKRNARHARRRAETCTRTSEVTTLVALQAVSRAELTLISGFKKLKTANIVFEGSATEVTNALYGLTSLRALFVNGKQVIQVKWGVPPHSTS